MKGTTQEFVLTICVSLDLLQTSSLQLIVAVYHPFYTIKWGFP